MTSLTEAQHNRANRIPLSTLLLILFFTVLFALVVKPWESPTITPLGDINDRTLGGPTPPGTSPPPD